MRSLASWSIRHRRLVVVLWLLLAVGVTLLEAAKGSGYSNAFTLKGTQSTQAIDLLRSASPRLAGDTDQIVISVRSGTVTDPAVETRVSAMLTAVSREPTVGSVASPYAANGGARQISRSGQIAYATVTFDDQANSLPLAGIKHVVGLAQAAKDSTVQIDLNGQAIERADKTSTSSLGFGFLAAAIVLILVFGSLLAAVLPLLTAGFALATGTATIGLLSNLISMPSFSEQLALLIGLGVGVDYALFIVTRHRQSMARGNTSDDAIVEALDTSGRAVLFAGITVCIAMLGMLTLGLSFLSGVGIAASIVVAFTVAAATTLLPALLGFFGPRTLTRRARRELADGHRAADDESRAWTRWAGRLRAHPVLLAAAAIGVMLVIAIPFASIRLGSSDAGSDPSGTTTRRAYDLLAEGFGPGFNGPLQLVAKIGEPGQEQQFQQVLAAVATTKYVGSVTPARILPNGVAAANVYETGSPQDASTNGLISNLRDHVLPSAEHGKVDVLVGGTTATFKDFSSVLSGKLPFFIGIVVLLSAILLMAVFRSLLIPLMAALMNLLSASAAFGVVTAVFQWGWLDNLIGVNQTGPIAAFLPVIVFAILFGLSMDYEVFLMSRIYEGWQRTHDNTEAVTHGLAATGRTITAAASIMVLVFAAFVLGGELTIKLFGIGLAAAVLLDALLVRSIIIPSVMIVMGARNWKLPAVLDRLLPQLNVEGEGSNTPLPAPGDQAVETSEV